MVEAAPNTRDSDPPACPLRPEVHRRFAADMVRLGVWYVRHLWSQGRIARTEVADALTRRVNLYRLTTLWDGHQDPALGHADARWTHLLARLAEIVVAAPAPDPERDALALVEPLLSGQPEPQPSPAFGCWSYRIVGEGIADRPGLLGRVTNVRKIWQRTLQTMGIALPPRHAELHFHNDVRPRSPFDEPARLARSLVELIADLRAVHPTVRYLWCSSWLNSDARFLALFPESWSASAVDRSPEVVDAAYLGKARLNTDNWWGVFVRADGSFHDGRARAFRESGGVFPLQNRLCHARLDEVESHLATRSGSRAP